MIRDHCFTREWIFQKREHLKRVDPTLLEKSIYAFELLGQLSGHGLNFVFKGGTSLLLLLKNFKRLSIDVDILCDETIEIMNQIFDSVIPSSPFVRWEEDPRTPSGIPKRHFKFYFRSVVNQREDYILLDVLRGIKNYPKTQSLPIDLDFFEVEKKVNVVVPTLNSLIGDKLTAFAPKTIGIPYQENRSMQIIKQLFDLGELFLYATDFDEISQSYNTFHAVENSYRDQNFSIEETLQDTIDACFLIAQLNLRNSIRNNETDLLIRGIQQIRSHLIGINFNIDHARIAASRTVMIAKIIQTNTIPPPFDIHFKKSDLQKIKDVELTNQLTILNRLKSFLPEGFYYWYLFSQLKS